MLAFRKAAKPSTPAKTSAKKPGKPVKTESPAKPENTDSTKKPSIFSTPLEKSNIVRANLSVSYKNKKRAELCGHVENPDEPDKTLRIHICTMYEKTHGDSFEELASALKGAIEADKLSKVEALAVRDALLSSIGK